MDDQYQTYINRVVRLTLPDTYQTQLQHIRESPKFQAIAPGQPRQPVAFPGYTVITPPGTEDADNAEFYQQLQAYQTQLVEQLDPGLLVPVPPESFHMTLADLIWSGAYHHAREQPGFEEQLRDRMTQIFQQTQPQLRGKPPIRWQFLGLMVMPRAMAICLAPKDETSYTQIVQLRRAIYQNSDLIALGIEQQYYLTAHVTLGYMGDVPAQLEQDPELMSQFSDRLSTLLSDLNHQWREAAPPEFQVRQAELRKFDDMTRYYRQPDWPTLQFEA